jgi:PAS domain S-box-containing protein
MQGQRPREIDRPPDRAQGAEPRLTLTRRESEVLARVQRGVENKAIAFELGVSLQSVKEHVSVLLRKFGVANRTSLAEAASRLAVIGERGVDQNWLPQFFRGAEPQICVLRGPELRYEAVNESFRLAVGNRPVIGRTMRESFPELVGQTIFERVERVYATGEPEIEHEAERRWDRGNGIESRQVDLVLQPLRDEDGKVNGVVSFCVDVTDLARPRRQADLIQEEFSAVLELVPSGVMVVDESGRIVTMNAAARRIARSPIDPVTVLGASLARALRGETVEDETHVFSGGDPLEDVRVRASTRPLRDDDGKIRGAVAVFTEVSAGR